MPHTLDAVTVRTWCETALEALGRSREGIDAINVYPVADGDTGTNLYCTLESAARAVEAVFAARATLPNDQGPATVDVLQAMAHGALIGARGNSGTILAQLLRGMSEVFAEEEGRPGTADPARDLSGTRLGRALGRAAESARQAVAHPVEGTVLSVASAAGEAVRGLEDDALAVAREAHQAAREALESTPLQLDVLSRNGVVDAGGCGLVTVLGALVQALGGGSAGAPLELRAPRVPETGAAALPAGGLEEPCPDGAATGDDPATLGYEVVYLLEAADEAVRTLRRRLDGLGDSLVVSGGDGLWSVHVHVSDAGAAVEAGIAAGRPYRIRITHFGAQQEVRKSPPPAQRVVLAVVPGDGLAALCREAGATALTAPPGEPPGSGELLAAIRSAHAQEVVLLPNDAELANAAGAAAEQARVEGVRVALIPTRSAVQGLAALAVHEPGRRFDEDVVSMTSAAGATRHAELVVAEHRSWTTAGICQAGDVLGLIDGDVAVIGEDLAATARTVVDRMLASGGELVTLVLADSVPHSLAERLETWVRKHHLAVDTVVYRGGQQSVPLIIGVE